MEGKAPLHLFEGFGVELEYMIVDRETLNVRPLTDRVLQQVAGKTVNEVDAGALCWSNELVLHVIELKTNGPATGLTGLAIRFQEDIHRIDCLLEPFGARLLATAMHPWMDPQGETVLWPHDNSPIYQAYNRIFGCRGHGWSNLQSMHLNLSFAGDEEFGRLHAAIRLVLPLLPALAASSPIVEGRVTGQLDNRLTFYRGNQKMLPSISGLVIPEAVYTKADYEEQILVPIYRDIAPLDPEGVLQEEWLNSRGAIARFERNAIEIRLLDVQECPLADLAIASLVTSLIRALTEERWRDLQATKALATEDLAGLFEKVMQTGDGAVMDLPGYLSCFGLGGVTATAGEIWSSLVTQLTPEFSPEILAPLQLITTKGPLARRILAVLPKGYSREELREVYLTLADCLRAGKLFDV